MARRLLPLCLAAIFISVVVGCREDASSSNSENGSSSSAEGKSGKLQPQLSKEDYQQAITLKNLGVGHLENKEWASAEASFAKLASLAPQSRLAQRNLAISRVLALTDSGSPFTRSGPPENAQKFDAAVAAAKVAVESYRDFATEAYDRALADLLMGKLLVHDDTSDASNVEQGIQLLKDAADALPNAADFRFALATAMDGHRDYADMNSPKSPELLLALQKSFELAPQNLFAMQRLMQRQALFLNSRNEETKKLALQVTDTMKQATKLLAPLNESIKKNQRGIDLVANLTKAINEFDGSNVATLMQPAMGTGHLIVSELATQIDMRRLNKNLLEYVLTEFDQGFQAAAAKASLVVDAPETVVTGFSTKPVISDLTGVSKLQLLDFDLDGRDDLVVLRSGRFEVYSRLEGDAFEWKLLLAAPKEVADSTGFLLADIDRDFDKTVPELRAPQLLLDRDGDRKIVQDPAKKNRWFDTDHDVVLWGSDRVTILRNELQDDGSRKLTIVPQDENVTGINDVVAADLEADGDLDLVFATDSGLTLWQNSDGSKFVNINASAALPTMAMQHVVACDWDRNIAMDVIGVPSNEGPCGLLQNIFHGRFRWLDAETGLEEVPAGSSLSVDQLDGAGSWDLVSAGPQGLSVVKTAGGADTSVKSLSATVLSTVAFDGAVVADVDNDGYSDIVAWSADSLQWHRGIGDGKFQDLSKLFPAVNGIVDVAVNDVDDDGDLDIVYSATAESSEGVPGILINDGGNENHWISVVARGKPDDDQFRSNRVNAHATGAIIEVRCGARYQAHLISDAKIHIGLGDCEKPDSIRIIWTDGIPQNVMTDSLLRPRIGVLAPQILLGSCPYIYTWTGERFEFFSDCLWAAPIGLVQANGEIAPTREWENLLIPGEALAAKDGGRYVLQLTEELWEVAYFDQVQLTAIDHPADVQIFTNEKVGPPNMAEHRIHTVKNARLPKSVVDGRGNDLLPGLTALDGDYVQAFEARVMQGLTDEWYMEFDLGSLPENPGHEIAAEGAAPLPQGGEDGLRPDEGEVARSGLNLKNGGDTKTPNPAPLPLKGKVSNRSVRGQRDIRLFLTGWVFPTDTSLNLGIEQNANLAPPAPPSIEVPDGNGGWKVVRPFIGFPSGKTKAMVVDISDIFEGDNLRFRLRSSMELYWDQAFFTVDEQDSETVVQPCPLLSGDLHYRGFSRRTYDDNALFRNGRAPEGYDYQSVTTDPRWPPIAGRYTKYGDASVLLFDHDDQMVVMGPGDELTIEFDLPDKPVPAGWKRDFVLRNVGYDKDANLNTIYGQSSEPFPFRAMSRYPFAPDERVPDSPAYRQYVEEWQTRQYSRKPFWNALQGP